MRISDWSSDVCSSDLPGRRAGGGDQRPAFARGGVTILVRTKTQRRAGISKSVRAELVEAPFFLTSLKKRRALRKAQGTRMLVDSSRLCVWYSYASAGSIGSRSGVLHVTIRHIDRRW